MQYVTQHMPPVACAVIYVVGACDTREGKLAGHTSPQHVL
jgi:hypothetical protein